VLAVSTPSTSPRRWVNQRVTMVAPSTMAVTPVPEPTTTPQSRINCHDSRISGVSATPVAITASAQHMVRRIPKRSMIAAANGPIMP
jgi:hypothetical protein